MGSVVTRPRCGGRGRDATARRGGTCTDVRRATAAAAAEGAARGDRAPADLAVGDVVDASAWPPAAVATAVETAAAEAAAVVAVAGAPGPLGALWQTEPPLGLRLADTDADPRRPRPGGDAPGRRAPPADGLPAAAALAAAAAVVAADARGEPRGDGLNSRVPAPASPSAGRGDVAVLAEFRADGVTSERGVPSTGLWSWFDCSVSMTGAASPRRRLAAKPHRSADDAVAVRWVDTEPARGSVSPEVGVRHGGV